MKYEEIKEKRSLEFWKEIKIIKERNLKEQKN